MPDDVENPDRSRAIPPPGSISAAARESLSAMMAIAMPKPPPPATAEEWEEQIAFGDRMLLAIIPNPSPETRVTQVLLGKAPAFDVVPQSSAARRCACTFTAAR